MFLYIITAFFFHRVATKAVSARYTAMYAHAININPHTQGLYPEAACSKRELAVYNLCFLSAAEPINPVGGPNDS